MFEWVETDMTKVIPDVIYWSLHVGAHDIEVNLKFELVRTHIIYASYLLTEINICFYVQ